MNAHHFACQLLLATASLALPGLAQAQRMPYGEAVTLDQARKVLAAAQAEAAKIVAPQGVSIAVVDAGCNLVALYRMDNTNLGGTLISQDKAYSACAFRLDTRGAQDRMTKGGEGMIFLQLNRMTAVEGGFPLVVGGKTIGAVGVSGGSSEQDGQIARAAAAALK